MEKKILLLDLGGVVASLGDPVEEIGLSISTEEFWDYWLSSPLVRDLETGRLSTAKFLRSLPGHLGEQAGDGFNQRFRQWRITPFAKVVSLLPSWASQFHLALLSNTNDIHWQGTRSPLDFSIHFEKLFLSFETGHFKPSVAAYEQVMEHYNCAPDDIHFLDDAKRNVLAARKLGINAFQVSGDDEVLRVVVGIAGK